MYNQRDELTTVPEALLLDNAVCVAPINHLGDANRFANPAEKLIANPNQDVVYGLGYLPLEKEPVVLQAPEIRRPLLDAPGIRRRHRSDQLGLALIGCGVLPLVVSIRQYRWTVRYLWGGSFATIAAMTREGMNSPVLAIGVLVALIGLFAFFAVLLRLA